MQRKLVVAIAVANAASAFVTPVQRRAPVGCLSYSNSGSDALQQNASRFDGDTYVPTFPRTLSSVTREAAMAVGRAVLEGKRDRLIVNLRLPEKSQRQMILDENGRAGDRGSAAVRTCFGTFFASSACAEAAPQPPLATCAGGTAVSAWCSSPGIIRRRLHGSSFGLCQAGR